MPFHDLALAYDLESKHYAQRSGGAKGGGGGGGGGGAKGGAKGGGGGGGGAKGGGGGDGGGGAKGGAGGAKGGGGADCPPGQKRPSPDFPCMDDAIADEAVLAQAIHDNRGVVGRLFT